MFLAKSANKNHTPYSPYYGLYGVFISELKLHNYTAAKAVRLHTATEATPTTTEAAPTTAEAHPQRRKQALLHLMLTHIHTNAHIVHTLRALIFPIDMRFFKLLHGYTDKTLTSLFIYKGRKK